MTNLKENGKIRSTRVQYVGRIFKSANYGDFVVLEYVDCSNVKIQFIDTKVECFVSSTAIKDGGVRDPSLPKFTPTGKRKKTYKHLGKLFSSKNYGDFIVVGEVSSTQVKIRFLNTETEQICSKGQIPTGNVRDYSVEKIVKPKTLNTVHKVGDNGGDRKLIAENFKTYQVWASMLQRCYSENRILTITKIFRKLFTRYLGLVYLRTRLLI
jgi:hypothetical protein